MTRPNFLLFVTDQQRADHLGCYGNTIVRTPHIDALAQRGWVFDNFHVATPICQPNRASIVTGRMPSAHGVRMNGLELSFAETSFLDILREAGYRTGLVGKSHLQNITAVPPPWPAPDEQRRPHDARNLHPGRYGQEVWKRWNDDDAYELDLPYYGFEHVSLTINHGDDQHGHWRRWIRRQTADADKLIGRDNAVPVPGLKLFEAKQAWRTRVPEELHPTSYIGQRTIDLLRDCAREGKPFFVQCSIPDPHHPFTPPGKYWDMYSPSDVALPHSFRAELHDAPHPIGWLRAQRDAGLASKGGYAAFACDEQEAREAIALNYGSISYIDDWVGRIVAELQRLGIERDTVIMFTSDHGDLMGDRQLLFKGGLHYRALTRVPFLWCDGAAAASGRSSGLAQTIDIAPTVLARAGLQPTNGMQGQALNDVTEGRAERVREALIVEEEGQRRDFGLSHRLRLRTLLTERYRFTMYDGEPWGELYDLHEDPHELANLWHTPGHERTRLELAAQLAAQMLAQTDTSPYPDASA